MLFGQDPFQNLADVQSNSQCLSKGMVQLLDPNLPLRRPGTKPWQRAQLWGFGSMQSNQSSRAQLSNSRMLLLLPPSHPCQCGCSQAVCHISVAQCDAPGAAPEASLPRLSAGKDGLTATGEAARLGDKKASSLASLCSAPAGLRPVPTAGQGMTLRTGGRALCRENPPVRICQNQQICTL